MASTLLEGIAWIPDRSHLLRFGYYKMEGSLYLSNTTVMSFNFFRSKPASHLDFSSQLSVVSRFRYILVLVHESLNRIEWQPVRPAIGWVMDLLDLQKHGFMCGIVGLNSTVYLCRNRRFGADGSAQH